MKPNYRTRRNLSSVTQCIALCLVGVITPPAQADENTSLTLAYGQSTNDYFVEQKSQLTSESQSVLWSRNIDSQWSISASLSKSDGSGQWVVFEGDNRSLANRAETSSDGFGVGVNWLSERFVVDFGFQKTSTKEQSIVFLPRVVERLKSDTAIIDLSLGSDYLLVAYSEQKQLSFDWMVGLQYADFDAHISDTLGTDTELLLETEIDLTQLGLFADFEVSFWFESLDFAWSPFINFGWNFEVNSSGEQKVLLSRGGEARPVNILDGRFTNDLKIPDSGEWGVGILFLLDNGLSFDFSYSKTIATDFPTNALSLSVSYFF